MRSLGVGPVQELFDVRVGIPVRILRAVRTIVRIEAVATLPGIGMPSWSVSAHGVPEAPPSRATRRSTTREDNVWTPAWVCASRSMTRGDNAPPQLSRVFFILSSITNGHFCTRSFQQSLVTTVPRETDNTPLTPLTSQRGLEVRDPNQIETGSETPRTPPSTPA